MGTRRRITPSLDDAGKMAYSLTIESHDRDNLTSNWNALRKELKKHYVKLAIEIWREVEKCI